MRLRTLFSTLLLTVFLSVSVFGAEQVDLTTPITKPTTNYYRVVLLTLDWDAAYIAIRLKGQNGEFLDFIYRDELPLTEATTLMTTLNTANLSTNSLHKRILNKLVADGKLAGTVSGTP